MSKDAQVFDAYAALRKHPDWHDKRDSILHREIAATLGYASGDVVRGIVNRERERRKQAPALTLVQRGGDESGVTTFYFWYNKRIRGYAGKEP